MFIALISEGCRAAGIKFQKYLKAVRPIDTFLAFF